MRFVVLLVTIFGLSACDNIKFKIVTDEEVKEQIDLLSKNGAWLCETSTGEGDKKLNVSSAVIALKTAPDEATLYSKTKVVSQLFEFGTTEVAFIKVGTGGEVSHQSYLSEFRDASLVQFPRETMVMLDNAKRQKLNALLTEAKSNFALDVRGFMEEPRSYKITELTTDTLVTQTTEGEISNCVHTATSNLYNDFGLITKQQGY